MGPWQDLDNEEYKPPRRVVVQTKDYNVMTLTDQIANDIITDVMVGPHGAIPTQIDTRVLPWGKLLICLARICFCIAPDTCPLLSAQELG